MVGIRWRTTVVGFTCRTTVVNFRRCGGDQKENDSGGSERKRKWLASGIERQWHGERKLWASDGCGL